MLGALLKAATPIEIKPICYLENSPAGDSVFYVENVQMANVLKDLNLSVPMSDGSKLKLIVDRCTAPRAKCVVVSSKTIAELKQAMGSKQRFNVSSTT